MEFYSAINRSEIWSHTATQMDLKVMMLRDRTTPLISDCSHANESPVTESRWVVAWREGVIQRQREESQRGTRRFWG